MDAVNGDDLNSGDVNNPFKTIYKAVSSAPIGSLTRVHLQSDIDMAQETASSPINSRNVVIYMNGFNIQGSTNASARYLYIGGGESTGFLKLMPTAGTETITLTEEPLIIVTDSQANVNIGDFDKKLTINTDTQVMQINRGLCDVFMDNVDVNCTADHQYVVVGEQSRVWMRGNCSLNNIIASSTDIDNINFLKATPLMRNDIQIFIDEVNGSDNNSGFEKNNPVKTLAVAIKRCMVGKNNQIRLLSNVTHKSSYGVISGSATYKKTIQIVDDNMSEPNLITFDFDYLIAAFQCDINSQIIFQVDISFVNTYDTTRRNVMNILSNSTIKFLYKPDATPTTVSIGDNATMCWVRDSSIILANDISISATNAALFQVGRFVEVGVEKSKKINGNTITDADISSNTVGVIKDANGVPRNIISNIIY